MQLIVQDYLQTVFETRVSVKFHGVISNHISDHTRTSTHHYWAFSWANLVKEREVYMGVAFRPSRILSPSSERPFAGTIQSFSSDRRGKAS